MPWFRTGLACSRNAASSNVSRNKPSNPLVQNSRDKVLEDLCTPGRLAEIDVSRAGPVGVGAEQQTGRGDPGVMVTCRLRLAETQVSKQFDAARFERGRAADDGRYRARHGYMARSRRSPRRCHNRRRTARALLGRNWPRPHRARLAKRTAESALRRERSDNGRSIMPAGFLDTGPVSAPLVLIKNESRSADIANAGVVADKGDVDQVAASRCRQESSEEKAEKSGYEVAVALELETERQQSGGQTHIE